VLLQVLDDGRLTDGEGWTVDFTNTVMLSNVGAGQARRPLGFTGAEADPAEDRMRAAAKQAFLPEFLNRIDELMVFEPLTEDQVRSIGEMLCRRITDRLSDERGVRLTVAPELVARLAAEGFDPEFGARPLKRHLRRTQEKELTRAILDGRIPEGGHVTAHDDDEQGIVIDVLVPATL